LAFGIKTSWSVILFKSIFIETLLRLLLFLLVFCWLFISVSDSNSITGPFGAKFYQFDNSRLGLFNPFVLGVKVSRFSGCENSSLDIIVKN